MFLLDGTLANEIFHRKHIEYAPLPAGISSLNLILRFDFKSFRYNRIIRFESRLLRNSQFKFEVAETELKKT